MQKPNHTPFLFSSVLNRNNVAGYVFILPFIISLLVFPMIPFFTSLNLAPPERPSPFLILYS